MKHTLAFMEVANTMAHVRIDRKNGLWHRPCQDTRCLRTSLPILFVLFQNSQKNLKIQLMKMSLGSAILPHDFFFQKRGKNLREGLELP